MNFLKKLDNSLLTAVIVLTTSIIGFAASSFLITSSNKDIPFGFLLSGGTIALLHVVSSLLVRIDVKRGSSIFSIISIAMRLVVLLTSMIIIMLMSYRWNLKLFNIFVFIGVYTFSVIIYMLTFIFRKNRKE